MDANKDAIATVTYNFQFQSEFTKTLEYLKSETRRTVFESIKASLGPHYQSALKVTTYGDAMGLYNQIEKFNPSDKEARKGLLIAQFWDACFQKEGANDLAVWINYITIPLCMTSTPPINVGLSSLIRGLVSWGGSQSKLKALKC